MWEYCLQVIACRDGAVTAQQVFDRPAKALAAKLNVEAQHRAAVAVALADGAQPAKKPKVLWLRNALSALSIHLLVHGCAHLQPVAGSQLA